MTMPEHVEGTDTEREELRRHVVALTLTNHDLRAERDSLLIRVSGLERERDARPEVVYGPSSTMVDKAEYDSLLTEREELREALTFYARMENHKWQRTADGEGYRTASIVDDDGGEIARTALAWTEPNPSVLSSREITDSPTCPTCRLALGEPLRGDASDTCPDPFHAATTEGTSE